MSASQQPWTIAVGRDTTSARYEPSQTGADRALFVCAHGAGGSMDDRGTIAVANAMRRVGLGVVRFNFLYKEKGSGRPDAMPRLIECFSAVIARARAESGARTQAVMIGGRSMGGRAASMMAAEAYPCAGLLLFAYPLHPAGQPEKLRTAHLPRISVPVLCFNGTRDPLCDRDLMERALPNIKAPWTMHWLDGADHSFHVLKSSGRNDTDVMREVESATQGWLDQVLP
ncbi:MAG TPA: alpha/beta family hydrolase [Gemmatimonadaceae bacterium]|nr:alpha/beta family hydrolase [Gemmatimonadaceae bacterium]